MPTTSQIFVLNGSPTAGKNTFVKMLPCDCVHYSYVDFTRSMLDYKEVDYKPKPNEPKSNKSRVLLETINNALEEFDDIPFKDCCDLTRDFLEGYLECEYLFVDIRKPCNIKRFLDEFKGARAVYIDDKRPISSVTESDSQVANYDYDFYIDNSGSLENLQREANRFIAEIRGDKS